MTTIIATGVAFIAGCCFGYIVCGVLPHEHKWDRQKVYDQGYTDGFNARRELT